MEVIKIDKNENYLRQRSKEVNQINNDVINDIKTLENYCKENEVMAIAGIQLQIPKRIIYLKNTNINIIDKMQLSEETDEEKEYNEGRVLINPAILKEEGLTQYWEACASCLDFMGLVKRPYKILVAYKNLNNEIIEEFFEGFEATVISHEIDHLDGILHIDKAEKVLNLPKEQRKEFRQQHKYEIFVKEGDYRKAKEITNHISKTLNFTKK